MSPKYKVGDWVIDTEDIGIKEIAFVYHIKTVKMWEYIYDIYNNSREVEKEYNFNIKEFDEETRLMTPLEKALK